MDFDDRRSSTNRPHKDARQDLERLRLLVERDTLPDMMTFLRGEYDGSFFSSDPTSMYAISWLTVHFLMNHDEARHRAQFREWLSTSENLDADSLIEMLGLSATEVDTLVRQHLSAF